MQDQSFDKLSQRFSRSIYGSPKGQIRLEVLLHHLRRELPHLDQTPLSVLDAGGGQGQFALKLAEQGHQITLCDISLPMLEQARQLFAAHRRSDQLTLIQCAIQQLGPQVERQFDLITCHAVLEWLADPRQTLAELCTHLAPGGYLSLMFFNRDAVTFNNIIRGNLHWALTDQVAGKGKSLSPTNPQRPISVAGWLPKLGLTLISHGGIRVFHDYVKQPLKQQSQQADLLALEKRYFDQPPFRDLGRYTHFLCRKGG